MRTFKKFGALALVVAAFSALGVGSASAAEFTASSTGSLSGSLTEDLVLNTGAGEVVCKKAEMTGTIPSTKATDRHVTLVPLGTSCKAFGIATVDPSNMTLNLTSNGQVHFVSPVTITVTGFLIHCTVTFPAQTRGTVTYTTSGTGTIVQFMVTGITSTGNGGLCGGHNSTGTLTGSLRVAHTTSGQTLSFDP